MKQKRSTVFLINKIKCVFLDTVQILCLFNLIKSRGSFHVINKVVDQKIKEHRIHRRSNVQMKGNDNNDVFCLGKFRVQMARQYYSHMDPAIIR